MTNTLSKRILNYVDPDLRIRIVKSYLYNGIETAAERAGLDKSDIEVIVKAFEAWSDKREISDVLFESYYEYSCQPGADKYIWFDESETDGGYSKPPTQGQEQFNAEKWLESEAQKTEMDIAAIVENVLDKYFIKAIGQR